MIGVFGSKILGCRRLYDCSHKDAYSHEFTIRKYFRINDSRVAAIMYPSCFVIMMGFALPHNVFGPIEQWFPFGGSVCSVVCHFSICAVILLNFNTQNYSHMGINCIEIFTNIWKKLSCVLYLTSVEIFLVLCIKVQAYTCIYLTYYKIIKLLRIDR